jgi:glc operon protein GlcG
MARERGWALGIVVLDEGGHPVYLFRMEGAAFPRVDFAREKAMTSLLTRRPSGVLLDRVLAGGTNLLTIPGYVAMRGGLPIVVEGRVIGAIGASGATAEEDEQCVARGIEAVFGRSATGLE